MRTALALVAALSLSFTAVSFDGAQAAAAKAKTAPCKDAKGKFTKCPAAGAATPAATAAAAAPAAAAGGHTYKLDKKGNCHDETGKFAKKAMCAAK